MATMNNEEVGNLLKQARKQSNLTQKEFADKLYYSPQSISLYENGTISMKLDQLFAFSKVVGISPVDFLENRLIKEDNPIPFDASYTIHYLKDEIQKKNITREMLLNTFNVSLPTLRKIETGEIIITIRQFLDLHDLLHFSIPEAFYPSHKDIDKDSSCTKEESKKP